MRWIALLCLLYSASAWAQSPAYPTRQAQYPGGINPTLYNPDHNIFDWKIKDSSPPLQPCHWDEPMGMWVGDCNMSLDTPGASITVPRTIRH